MIYTNLSYLDFQEAAITPLSQTTVLYAYQYIEFQL